MSQENEKGKSFSPPAKLKTLENEAFSYLSFALVLMYFNVFAVSSLNGYRAWMSN
jgi:hypothetical protein